MQPTLPLLEDKGGSRHSPLLTQELVMTVTCWAWGQPVPLSSQVTSPESCPGPAGSRLAVPAWELPVHLLCASLVYGSLLASLSPPGLCIHRTGSRSADSDQADFTDRLAHFHIHWHSNPSSSACGRLSPLFLSSVVLLLVGVGLLERNG